MLILDRKQSCQYDSPGWRVIGLTIPPNLDYFQAYRVILDE